MGYKSVVADLLRQADIEINGTRLQDIQVHDERFYQRFLRDGRLGLGESYMDGWWDCPRIDEFTRHIYHSKLKVRRQAKTLRFAWTLLKSKLIPEGSASRAYNIAHKHYDAGNDLFASMLDKRMVYTCAYWKDAKTLDEAQEAKLDLACRKLKLKPGMRVLDVGCGWGSFAKFAAEKYGVKVTGISVSTEQIELARTLCKGLAVDFQVMDYRDALKLGVFDRIVSLGMFEHVGTDYFRTFYQTMSDCLVGDGLFLLHTNILNDSHYFSPWLTKYIFPGGYVPSLSQTAKPMEGLFFAEHLENIGPYYYKTFLTWYDNFERNWDKIKHQYDERFFRMWKYYLLSVAAGYEARFIQVYQMVLAKESFPGPYSYP